MEPADQISPEITTAVSAADAVRQRVRALDAGGQILEAMHVLAAYLAQGRAQDPASDFAEDIRALKLRAFAHYNASRQAGDVARAESYVAGLAMLTPEHAGVLGAVLECNVVLGRLDKAVDTAVALLTLDGENQQAIDFFVKMRASPQTREIEIARRIALASAPRSGKAALDRLRDLDAAASAVLSAAPDPHAVHNLDRVREVVDLVATAKAAYPPGTGGALWETYHRLKFNVIDLAALASVRPENMAEDTDEPIAFSTTEGAPLDWNGVCKTADSLGARAVFFAAADEGYVARYARLFAGSALASCDIPCLVIVHVIGGAGNLPALAAAIGISDSRLILAGDVFDAAAMAAKVVDSPFRGPITVPVAYFQSVRFLRLGAILRHLNRPVFVSDIDTLLQRGVADLLAAHAQADVVINENARAFSLVDRLTANLLLVNPTSNAMLFVRFLRHSLERCLRKPEVTRWIDQIALLQARYYLQRLPGGRVGAFDTTADINNVMLASYGPNPFRFLSLYRSFDLSTLNGVMGLKVP